MLSPKDLDPKDCKYMTNNPSYNPRRSQAIIAETIKETTAYFKKNAVLLDDNIKERIEAVSAYGCYRFNRGQMTPETYFGKAFWNKFVGEKILSKIRVAKTVNKLNGNDKFKDFITL